MRGILPDMDCDGCQKAILGPGSGREAKQHQTQVSGPTRVKTARGTLAGVLYEYDAQQGL